jgi:hypothetical protein
MRDENVLTVVELNGGWFAIEIVAGPFPDNASAWRWADRNSRQRESRRAHPALPSNRSDKETF